MTRSKGRETTCQIGAVGVGLNWSHFGRICHPREHAPGSVRRGEFGDTMFFVGISQTAAWLTNSLFCLSLLPSVSR
jgi:hypothetical protein